MWKIISQTIVSKETESFIRSRVIAKSAMVTSPTFLHNLLNKIINDLILVFCVQFNFYISAFIQPISVALLQISGGRGDIGKCKKSISCFSALRFRFKCFARIFVQLVFCIVIKKYAFIEIIFLFLIFIEWINYLIL